MKKVIATNRAPKAVGPYSQAIESNGTLYVSGQLPIDPDAGTMPETIAGQTRQCLKNIGAILDAAGYGYGDVVKSTVLLSDIAYFKEMNEVYAEFYTAEQPARVCYAVRDLPMGAMVEIETIASK